jgi:TolB-like protein
VAANPPIPAEAITAELERILASKGFANAGRLSRLLRYVVERTLAGEADQLKEYAVGVEVFDRDEKYDPRLDSIVRVEAGRLRSRLEEYYNGEGAQDEVHIVLPRGGYSAQFERRNEPVSLPVVVNESGAGNPKERAASTKWAAWALAIGAVAVVAAVAAWALGGQTPNPGTSIAVLAFEQYSSSGEDESVAAQVTDGVTSELARLGTLSVVSHTSAMQFAGERKPVREIAAALDADVILEGSIQNNPDGIVAVVRLVNAATDRKMWVENFPGQTNDIPGLNRRIAAAVSAAVLERIPAR